MPVGVFALGVGATVGVAAVAFVAPPLLGAVGFGATGPVAGSFAAGTQAGIGNVAAGSAFATAQSIGMGGSVPAALSAAGGVLGAAGAAIIAFFS